MNMHQIYALDGKCKVFIIHYSKEVHIYPEYRILTGAQTRRRKGIDAPEEDVMREQVGWRGIKFIGKGLLSEILVAMD